MLCNLQTPMREGANQSEHLVSPPPGTHTPGPLGHNTIHCQQVVMNARKNSSVQCRSHSVGKALPICGSALCKQTPKHGNPEM